MTLLDELTEPERNLVTRALEVFDGWCRDGNYTLTSQEWLAWQTLRSKLFPVDDAKTPSK